MDIWENEEDVIPDEDVQFAIQFLTSRSFEEQVEALETGRVGGRKLYVLEDLSFDRHWELYYIVVDYIKSLTYRGG